MQNAGKRKKRKKRKNFKTILLLCLIGFMYTNCEKEITIDQSDIDGINQGGDLIGTEIEYISGDDDPGIMEVLSQQMVETSEKSVSAKGVKYKKTYIDLKKIMKVTDGNGITNYSMAIEVQNSPSNIFYNVVINQKKNGKKKDAYIVKYAMTPDDYDNFMKNGMNFLYLKGTRTPMTFNYFYHDIEEQDDIEEKSEGTEHICVPSGYWIDNHGGGEDGNFSGMDSENTLQPIGYYNDTSGGDYDFQVDGFDRYGNYTSHSNRVDDEELRVGSSDGEYFGGIRIPRTMPNKPLIIKFRIIYHKGGGCSLVITKVYIDGTTSSTHPVTKCPPQGEYPDQHKSTQKNKTSDPGECMVLEEGEVGTVPSSADVALSSLKSCVDLTATQEDHLDNWNSSRTHPIGIQIFPMYDMVVDTDCSDRTKEFISEAIDILMEVPKGQVQWPEHLIIDAKSLGPEQTCILNKVKNVALWKNNAGSFKDDPKYYLKVEGSNECRYYSLGDVRGCTNFGDLASEKKLYIRITANPQPHPLQKAKTFLHEGIHAKLWRSYDKSVSHGVPDPDDKEGFWNFVKVQESLGNKHIQHAWMRINYVTPLATALRELDGNRYPVDHYEYFAWQGLNPVAYGVLTTAELVALRAKSDIMSPGSTFGNNCD